MGEEDVPIILLGLIYKQPCDNLEAHTTTTSPTTTSHREHLTIRNFKSALSFGFFFRLTTRHKQTICTILITHKNLTFISWLKRWRKCIAVNGTPSHSYRVSLVIWDHTVLPVTQQKWTHLALTTAMQAGTRFTYAGGIEGWVDLVDLIAPRPGVEPATFRSRVRRSTNATTKTAKLSVLGLDIKTAVW